jgi:hypothetical protein
MCEKTLATMKKLYANGVKPEVNLRELAVKDDPF